jgi:hypothetical protein
LRTGSRHSEIFPQHGKLDPPKGITSLWYSEMQKGRAPMEIRYKELNVVDNIVLYSLSLSNPKSFTRQKVFKLKIPVPTQSVFLSYIC